MKKIEDRLSEQRLEQHGPELDARMGRLFDDAPNGRRGGFRIAIPLWQAIAACAVSVAIGYWLPGREQDAPQVETFPQSTIIYLQPSQDGTRPNVFDATSGTEWALFSQSEPRVVVYSPLDDIEQTDGNTI